ncbi:MAG: hypothetical protein HC854_15170 [Flavobacterium sp.]|nr:hypothetical protein [Flavobacterium sp.]
MHNLLLKSTKIGIEILVPMIDYFIIEVNRKEKKLILTTPPGLVDLYLS